MEGVQIKAGTSAMNMDNISEPNPLAFDPWENKRQHHQNVIIFNLSSQFHYNPYTNFCSFFFLHKQADKHQLHHNLHAGGDNISATIILILKTNEKGLIKVNEPLCSSAAGMLAHASVIFLACHPVVDRWNCMLMDYFYLYFFLHQAAHFPYSLMYMLRVIPGFAT